MDMPAEKSEKVEMSSSRKMHPQKRVYSVMAEMIENRHPDREQASEWLERGWNPFVKQVGAEWNQRRPAFEMMVESGRWEDWLWQNKVRLASLARDAYETNALGKVEARSALEIAAKRCWSKEGSALGFLLEIGVDPNSKPDKHRVQSPMKEASSMGARVLVDAGWVPGDQPGEAQSLWSHWANRLILDRLAPSELDWLETVVSFDWKEIGAVEIGRKAMERPCDGSLDVLSRLAKSKAPSWVYGSCELEVISRLALDLMRSADSSKMIEAMGQAWGWPALVEAFAFDSGQGSAAGEALFSGRVKSLGILREKGLFGAGDEGLLAAVDACALRWEAAANSKAKRAYWDGKSPAPAGMIWAISRLSKASGECASRAFARCASSFPEKAARLAKTCASKGFLKGSGPESVHELYGAGKQWDDAEAGQSFESFVALVESKLFKQAFAPKKAKKAMPSRSL